MERWKDIDGFDGLYKISDYGRVISYKQCKPRFMKTQDDGHGYRRLRLRKNGKYMYAYIHRLVAEAFIINENKYDVVNHKDENKCNNYYGNLEWCDREYNLNYGTSRKRAIENTRRKVIQYSLDYNFIKEWDSIVMASKVLGVDNSSITKNCKNKVKSAGGYVWKYKFEKIL